MQANLARYAIVVLTAVAFSGCQWNAPNLAFWKSRPFQSSTNSTTPAAVAQGTQDGSSTPTTGYPTRQNPYSPANTAATSPSYQPPSTPAYMAGNSAEPRYDTGAVAPPYGTSDSASSGYAKSMVPDGSCTITYQTDPSSPDGYTVKVEGIPPPTIFGVDTAPLLARDASRNGFRVPAPNPAVPITDRYSWPAASTSPTTADRYSTPTTSPATDQ